MTIEAAMRDMNPIPEPDELREAECNAQGLYGLPAEAFASAARLASGASQAQHPHADDPVAAEPHAD